MSRIAIARVSKPGARALACALVAVLALSAASIANGRTEPLTRLAASSSPQPGCKKRDLLIRLKRGVPSNPLAPVKRLTEVGVCRYFGTVEEMLPVGEPNDSGVLVGSKRLRGGAARRLTAAFDALPDYPEGPSSCEGESAAAIYLTFVYQGGERVHVLVHLLDCPRVSNGPYTKPYVLTKRLARRLDKLVPPRAPAS